MAWIGWICCKKFYATLWLELLHLLQQFVLFSTEYRKATERSQMHPNTTEANKSLGSNGVDQGIRCEKFRHNFVAWSFPLIAPAQPILHQVSCSNEMVPNAPKHYETQQKLSLGSNGVDQVRSLRKHPMQLRGMNFCINWTSSAHFAMSLLS